MITLTDYKEINENLDLELYEVLEKEDNGFNLIITYDRGVVTTYLHNYKTEASHSLDLNDFKIKSLEQLNIYINNVRYYNSVETN